MSRRPSLSPPRLRARRHQRLLAVRSIRESIISLAGLLGRPVVNQAGAEIGRVQDIVARWDEDQPYPPVSGVVVKVGRRVAFIDAEVIDAVTPERVVLHSSRVDLRDFARREGEHLLAHDLLDHQLVDVDGVQVIRAADLYLAPVRGRVRLVGVDVGVKTLLRRLGPRPLRSRATPGKVLDWAAVQPFPESDGGEMRLRVPHEGLHRLRPGELADLLEDLGRPERRELLAQLHPETAADALEEMDPDELGALLREAPPEQAADLISSMEPDEAVDALRELGQDERDEVFDNMPLSRAEELARLLNYDRDEAGGFMTTALAVAGPDETVESVRRSLMHLADHRQDIDAVALVDGQGLLVADLPLFDLLVAPPGTRMADLCEEDSQPVSVSAGAPLKEVADRLVEARSSSVVVVDNDGRPVGRILADDVVDALLPDRGRFHFPRLLQ